MDLKLELSKSSINRGDLAFENADFQLVTEKEAIVQDVVTALRVFFGECFMDNTIGIDFFGQVLVKNPDQGKIDALFINAILSVPGVQSLLEYSFAPDFLTRQLGIRFKAQTIAGIVDYTGTVQAAQPTAA